MSDLERELRAQIRREFEAEMEMYRQIAAQRVTTIPSFDGPSYDRFEYAPNRDFKGRYLKSCPVYGELRVFSPRRPRPSLEEIDQDVSYFERELGVSA